MGSCFVLVGALACAGDHLHPAASPDRPRPRRPHQRKRRFESATRESFDDGWTPDDLEPVQLTTTVSPEKAKVIITRNDSPDVGFSASINPYRGCEHGCIYCYARPAHAYMGLSPGLDFESKLFFKPEAARLLERELSNPRYVPETIHIGGNTDPYQPQERRLRVTRQIVEVLSRFNHPFSIISKSGLILRDLTSSRLWPGATWCGWRSRSPPSTASSPGRWSPARRHRRSASTPSAA